MNTKKEQFLGGYGAVFVTDEQDLEQVKTYLSQLNKFLPNGEPVSRLKYTKAENDFMTIYIGDTGRVEYSTMNNLPEHIKFCCSVKEIITEGQMSMDDFFGMDLQEESNEIPLNSDEPTLSEQPQEIIDPNNFEFKVTSIVPAQVDSNIELFKQVIIPHVLQYKNIVVTKENYKDIKKMLTKINSSKKEINDYKIKVKKAAKEPVDVFEASVKEIMKAYDEVIVPLKEGIAFYENQEKEAKKQKIINEWITPIFDVAIESGALTKEDLETFAFNESWLKSSATKKSIQEDINAYLNSVIEQKANYEKQFKEQCDMIQDTFNRELQNKGLTTNALSIDSYIEMLKNDMPINSILKAMYTDIENLASLVAEVKEETINEVASQTVDPTGLPEPTIEQPTYQDVADSRTGELIGKFNEQEVVANIKPNRAPGVIYKYQYEFEGDASVIATLASVMKILKAMNSTFNYQGRKM